MFEYHSKCRIWVFSILAFFTIFCPIKINLSGNTVWPRNSAFQKLAKLTIFGIFKELLSTQNVTVARFARKVEYDFLSDFQTSCDSPTLCSDLRCYSLCLYRTFKAIRTVPWNLIFTSTTTMAGAILQNRSSKVYNEQSKPRPRGCKYLGIPT